MSNKQKEALQAKAKKNLLGNGLITPDTTLGIVITNTSASGMTRRMRVLVDGFRDISYMIADLCDLSINEKGLKIGGCGMDMTFWLADHITYCLWGKDKPEGLKGNGGGCLQWKAIY